MEQLITLIEELLGPNGCPWDKEQTMMSVRSSILEETCEFIEAIDLGDSRHMVEELGDVLFNVIFFAKLGEKEKRFTLQEVVAEISEKLVRRHPHVFGNVSISQSEDVLIQWDKIKQQEKGKEERKNVFEGIPKQLPSLLRAQKIFKKVPNLAQFKELNTSLSFGDEESLGNLLAAIAIKASSQRLDAEQALRNFLAKLEKND